MHHLSLVKRSLLETGLEKVRLDTTGWGENLKCLESHTFALALVPMSCILAFVVLYFSAKYRSSDSAMQSCSYKSENSPLFPLSAYLDVTISNPQLLNV